MSADRAIEVSPPRLYALRAGYLMLVLGLGLVIWPRILGHGPWPLMFGVVQCMLAAISALAVLGLRRPLQMLPLLFFELAWKAIWLAAVALPAWRTGNLDSATLSTVYECLVVVVFVVVIPWRYVLATYLARPADRWRRAEAAR